MTALRLFALRYSVAFVALFVVAVPLSYNVIPDPGGIISPVVEPTIGWVGRSLLGIDGDFTAAILSDSTGMYIGTLLALLLAAVIAGLWQALDRQRRDPARLRYWFHAGISYYLALHLLRYGFDKLFKSQFYLPEPNTAFTPLGYLAPDILYWSTVGSSYSYSLFGGVVEILPALLLLFDRTRWIGAIGAAMVMIHVVMLNFAFDISVKIFSLFLLLLALIVATPALVLLYRLFLLDQPVRADRWRPSLDSPRARLLYTILKPLLVGVILFESLYLFFATGNFNDDQAERPPLHGAYDVESFVRNGDTIPPLAGDTSRFRRFFVHRRGYFITQSMNDAMTDYRLAYDTVGRKLQLLGSGGESIVVSYELSGNDSLLALHGRIDGDTVDIEARRIDLEKLPLYRGGFHWTIDGYR